MNKVILLGRLARDVELKMTTSGASVCSFSVACDRPYTQDGERKTDFIACVAWRQQAEFIAKYFRKGDRIALDGSLQVRSWEDSSGIRRYATEVIVDHVEFAQSKGERAGGQAVAKPQAQAAAVSGTAAPYSDDDDYNAFCIGAYDDLPF